MGHHSEDMNAIILILVGMAEMTFNANITDLKFLDGKSNMMEQTSKSPVRNMLEAKHLRVYCRGKKWKLFVEMYYFMS